MEPMRRPVLPSSGQAYDEINIVRFSAAGRKRCPVSGATMKFAQSSIVRTPDYALRSVIRHQARQAKVSWLPPALLMHHHADAHAHASACWHTYVCRPDLRTVSTIAIHASQQAAAPQHMLKPMQIPHVSTPATLGQLCCVSYAGLAFHHSGMQQSCSAARTDVAGCMSSAVCMQVYIPPLDREELVQDMRSPEHCQDAVKAFVDDVYLGYLHASELHAALEELMPGGGSRPVQDSLPLYCQIIAECLACRRPGIVSAALQSVQGSAECNKVLADANVLRECLGVGEVTACCSLQSAMVLF